VQEVLDKRTRLPENRGVRGPVTVPAPLLLPEVLPMPHYHGHTVQDVRNYLNGHMPPANAADHAYAVSLRDALDAGLNDFIQRIVHENYPLTLDLEYTQLAQGIKPTKLTLEFTTLQGVKRHEFYEIVGTSGRFDRTYPNVPKNTPWQPGRH
jgi:hypothetical protein